MSGDHDPQPGPAADPPKSIFGQIQDAAIQASIQPFTQKISDAQTRIKQGDSRLSELGAGIDPAYTSTDDHFEGMSHQELYEAVHGIGGLDPEGLQTMRQTWFECASELENLSAFTLIMGMNNIFGHGLWKGGAADAAQAASERYARVANHDARGRWWNRHSPATGCGRRHRRTLAASSRSTPTRPPAASGGTARTPSATARSTPARPATAIPPWYASESHR